MFWYTLLMKNSILTILGRFFNTRESQSSPRMVSTNECQGSTTVSRPLIVLLPIYTSVCKDCKTTECTDAKVDTIHLVQQVRGFLQYLTAKADGSPNSSLPFVPRKWQSLHFTDGCKCSWARGSSRARWPGDCLCKYYSFSLLGASRL